ncbi:AraC family transcriptional regulator [Tetragenococcus koreensis]|uniref:AraC family transcriptional regulator n=1 Tax=Tetragenococcus koreensis TaxID=290335 RepID=UPI001F3EB6CE|nr:AraC family transcriptional regulator [Tetragenococcus koreensis]MCF1586111.1 AraC family transcriptional regulator [Tetragenococcus koreensis]MCF1615698.1 AraC family transcriptional regulator [Tetragenococcus koreensis]MCF1618872.1 AraC family transcriptional regulator [Tetragenococcus koreensis]MCF1625495.1 AraC family transcriptional regulator [Tetragenococcus koreensis]MCF1630384.1 AraC family transcriptional regulator [Tetragenococcus koreensis]
MQQLFLPKAFTGKFDLQTPHIIYISKVNKEDRNHPRTLHSHSDIVELLLITGGQGIIFIDEEQVAVQKGDLVVYNSGVVHEESFRNEAVSLYCIGLRGTNEKNLRVGGLIPEQSYPVLKTNQLFPAIVNLFETCYFVLEQGKLNYATIVQQLFETLLLLLKSNILQAEDVRVKNNEKLAIVQDIKLHMDKNYAQDFKIKDLENNKQWPINSFYFAHKFKEIYGYSPIEYLQRRRVGEAQTLLINTNYSITEIANSVGFNSSAYFSTLFKKLVSLSPKEYRKRYVKQ